MADQNPASQTPPTPPPATPTPPPQQPASVPQPATQPQTPAPTGSKMSMPFLAGALALLVLLLIGAYLLWSGFSPMPQQETNTMPATEKEAFLQQINQNQRTVSEDEKNSFLQTMTEQQTSVSEEEKAKTLQEVSQ